MKRDRYFLSLFLCWLISAACLAASYDNKLLVTKEIPMIPDAVFDFDFTGIDGLQQYRDRTNNFTLYSDCGTFLEEYGALRVAFGSRFRIPCRNDALSSAFTISAWIMKSERDWLYHTPILGRGYQQPGFFLTPQSGKFDFQFYVDIRLPGFATKAGGLTTTGYYYNMNIQYLNSDYARTESRSPLELNRWQHLAGVYSHGSVKIYLNGQLIAENPQKTTEPLCTTGLDLYLGAYRIEGETANKVAAEMLIKSIRVENHSLSAEQIQSRYLDERKYLPMDVIYPVLAETRNYFPSDMLALDPEMKTRLSQTAEYLGKRPFCFDYPPAQPSLATTPVSFSFRMNGKKTAPVNGHGHISEHPEKLAEFVADFAGAGIDMAGVGVPESVWQGKGEYDWSELHQRLDAVLFANPAALLDIVIGTNAPPWFREQHPEELEEYYVDFKHPERGKQRWTGYGGPMGSDLFLELSAQMLFDVVSHLEQSKYGKNIYGYLISGGDAGEWYWPGQFAGADTATGYSGATENAFRNYLKELYQNNLSQLREAWKNPEVTFDNARIPTPNERFASENLFFRDPVQARKVFDCRHFLQYRNILNVSQSIQAVRAAAGSEKIITTYYGYSLLYCGAPALAFSGLQTVSDLLKNPDLDFIATPIDYGRRRGGEPGVNIAGFLGTAQLYGKGIWREEDLRTHLHTRVDNGRTADLRETLEVLRRGYGYTMAENYGMWYICQFGIHGYHQNEIMEDAARMKKLADEAALSERRDVAEVALIFDEKGSMDVLAPLPGYNQFAVRTIWNTYLEAHQMGAPFKLYFLDDLSHPEMPDFKLYVFLNAWSVSAEQKKMIHQKISRGNAVAVWIYAAGYLDGKAFNPDNMTQLTGFRFDELRQYRKVGTVARPAEECELLAGVAALDPAEIGPLFSVVQEEGVQVLGQWHQSEKTLATREMNGWRSVWTLLPPSARMLTNLCRYAGVHIYTEGGETLLANDSWLMMISPRKGAYTIQLPNKRKVCDSIEGIDMGELQSIRGELPEAGMTKIFQLK